MTARRSVAAMIALPLAAITIYLLWIWPSPRSTSPLAEVAPYVASLLTGAPFAWMLARGRARVWLLFAFLVGGFVVLWVYAIAVLCGVRGVCL